LGTKLHYRRIDVRDTELLNNVIEEIATAEGRMDGLVAAAGIQQETPALEYTAKDANTMFEINVTGVFMTAQAVAKQMIRFGNGGSIVLIASMSGTIANKVRFIYAALWGLSFCLESFVSSVSSVQPIDLAGKSPHGLVICNCFLQFPHFS
jgi:NADP-dependent 3-hydroxy acid dehydrogenase YdfG